jgi:hypothetical protein
MIPPNPQPVRPELARRIVRETTAVQTCFPDRFHLRRTTEGFLYWAGEVPVEGHDFSVKIVYPGDYPAGPPRLFTPEELPAGCPHVLSRSPQGTELCWIAPNTQTTRRRWDPQRHTAATVMRAAQRWALALLVWQALGLWPVPDAWEV